MVGLDNIDPQRRHWYSEEHFARQLGNPAARAVVEGRWRLLEAEVKRWLERDRPAQASSSAPLRILDAGCGDGINLLALSRIFADLRRPIRLQGIDYNDLRIERAKALGLDCELGVGSLADTGLAAASVDMILLNHVLEHIPDKQVVLGELRRILRPGGLFVVGVPNEGCTLAKLRNRVLQRSILRTTDHVHFFTSTELRRSLEAAGFKVDRIAVEGFFVPHLRIASLAGRTAAGRSMMAFLGSKLPSQAAGLIAIARAGDATAG
ncbi:MAG: class I SAM-dependent methyltransferase [Hyphomicrobiaceae bacterium]|nr:class I SAM-dependent methyltransferase [Hyphomicrobiaceae bacterium]